MEREVMEKLITEFNEKIVIGKTALHWAVKNNDVPQVEKLIAEGANVNARDTNYVTPLHEAAGGNINESHLNVAEILLRNDASLTAMDNCNHTPLYSLAKNGTLKFVKFLLESSPDTLNMMNDRGNNLLASAVNNHKNPDVLEYLIELGLDVNHRNLADETPLLYATRKYRNEDLLNIAEILLSKGANILALDIYKCTPLYYLVQKNNNANVVELFLRFLDVTRLSDVKKHYLLSSIVQNENVEVLKLFLEHGFDVNQRNPTLRTIPLHYACKNLNLVSTIKIMKCLMINGGDVNAFDIYGVSLLIKALSQHTEQDPADSVKKYLNFIAEHTDFSVAANRYSLFLHYENRDDWLWKIVLKHLAKMHTLGISMQPDTLTAITEENNYYYFYIQCFKELARAKNEKFLNATISYFDLLVDSRRKIKNYASNENIIEYFKNSNCSQKFPIYGRSMYENFMTGVRRKELYDESAVVLSKCIPIFGSTHLIVRDILDQIMSKKDLYKFCKQNDL